MGKHTKVPVDIPAWVNDLSASEGCLRSVAEDAYTAKAFAESYGATRTPKCVGLLTAANRSLRVLENAKAKSKIRCHEGDRAARKFWEAKVCARE